MPDAVFLFVNGVPQRISDHAAFGTLATFLRTRLELTGTKIVCEEGDCGACSVLVGAPSEKGLDYRPINSCIQFVFQLDGTHVVTVEGLRTGGALHPVQEAMIRCHGAQCGYCTPGFVVAMCAMYEAGIEPSEKSARDALTGNLCRCTGYEPIIKAVLDVDPAAVRTINELYPPETMLGPLREHVRTARRLEHAGRTFYAPATIEEAIRFKSENPGVVIVQGATDIGVQHTKRGLQPAVMMTLGHIPQLSELTFDRDLLSVGATVTLTRLEDFYRDRVPEFHRILELFGAPQIKHAGTLAGNVANASPIADSLPFLSVMDAEVELTGLAGARRVSINSFYLGYKTLDLRPDELITRILIPMPPSSEILKLYKVSKRKNLDISTFTAAIRMRIREGRIEGARIAYGGVGPTVLRLPRTEGFLEGKAFIPDVFREAGETALGEIAPISDVRGAAAFRNRLAGNVLMKFYYESAASAQEAAR
ncbi:MAG TPA: FAD binding domain-containing protein [Thermoanaerobaculia bacterium]|nr:FAD binding domain-containing protein [Thermoanaerobaculia bacterium]